jgi:hypothetical protein
LVKDRPRRLLIGPGFSTEVYIEQPLGFEVEDRKSHVCRLKRALYRLNQAPRAWYGHIDSFLTSLGFTKSKADTNLYFKIMDNKPVILLLYVDDLFLTREEKLIVECKQRLAAEFEMKDLGLMHYFLGLEVWQSPERIFLNQGNYTVEILKRFDMLECKSMNTPMEAKLKLLVDTSSDLIDATLYRVQIDYWIVDVPDEHQTRHLFCSEHLESVSGRAQTCSSSGCKTCDEVP